MAKRIVALVIIAVIALLVVTAAYTAIYPKMQWPEAVSDVETILWCQDNTVNGKKATELKTMLMEEVKIYPESIAFKEKRVFVIHFYEIYYKTTGVWYSWKTCKLR